MNAATLPSEPLADGLYNRAVKLPASLLAAACRRFRLHFTRHALTSALNDRYGTPNLKPVIEVQPEQLVEALVERGVPVKFVVRQPNDAQTDVVLVIRPEGEVGHVITVWVNDKNDQHSTLNKSLVAR